MGQIHLKQGTNEWLDWRKDSITGSMIPIICNASKHKSPYELWAECVGLKPEDDLSNNPHVARGNHLEAVVRDFIEKRDGKDYPAACFEFDQDSRFKASLDCINEEDGVVGEIKCPCEKVFKNILTHKHKAPEFVVAIMQLNWGMLVSGMRKGFLCFYCRDQKPLIVPVTRDDAFLATAQKKAMEFLSFIENKTPPPLREGDVIFEMPEDINHLAETPSECDFYTPEEWEENKKKYASSKAQVNALKLEIKRLDKEAKKAEDYFSSFAEHLEEKTKGVHFDGMRIIKVKRKAKTDYEKLSQHLAEKLGIEIDSDLLDQFKSEDTEYIKVKADKELLEMYDVSKYQSLDAAVPPDVDVTPQENDVCSNESEKSTSNSSDTVEVFNQDVNTKMIYAEASEKDVYF